MSVAQYCAAVIGHERHLESPDFRHFAVERYHSAVSVGFVAPMPLQRHRPNRFVSSGGCRDRAIVTAALYKHPAGTELRVFLGPESADDVLHTDRERFDVGALEAQAIGQISVGAPVGAG